MPDTSVERLLSILSQLNPEYFSLALHLAEQALKSQASEDTARGTSHSTGCTTR